MSNKNKSVLPVTPNAETPVVDLKDEIAKQQQILKDLRAKAKESKAKEPRVNKGIKVKFTNKAGENIEGLGVLYYVVRQGGKLHYKEASAVTVLPEEIKEA